MSQLTSVGIWSRSLSYVQRLVKHSGQTIVSSLLWDWTMLPDGPFIDSLFSHFHVTNFNVRVFFYHCHINWLISTSPFIFSLGRINLLWLYDNGHLHWCSVSWGRHRPVCGQKGHDSAVCVQCWRIMDVKAHQTCCLKMHEHPLKTSRSLHRIELSLVPVISPNPQVENGNDTT